MGEFVFKMGDFIFKWGSAPWRGTSVLMGGGGFKEKTGGAGGGGWGGGGGGVGFKKNHRMGGTPHVPHHGKPCIYIKREINNK